MKLLLAFLLVPMIAVADPTGGYVDPWLGGRLWDQVRSLRWKGEGQEPLARLDFRTVELEDKPLRLARLGGGRVIAMLGSDRKTIRFFDLATSTVRQTFREDEAVVDLLGCGDSVLSYQPASGVLSLRRLSNVESRHFWQPDPTVRLIALGIAGEGRLKQVVAVDESGHVWRLSPFDLKPMQSPLSLHDARPEILLQAPRSRLDPLVRLDVAEDGSFRMDRWAVTFPARGRLEVADLGIRTSDQRTPEEEWALERSRERTAGILIPVNGSYYAEVVEEAPEARLAIRAVKTGNPWLELNGLPRCDRESVTPGDPRPTTLSFAERVFLAPAAGRIAILDPDRGRLQVADFDPASFESVVPRLLDPARRVGATSPVTVPLRYHPPVPARELSLAEDPLSGAKLDAGTGRLVVEAPAVGSGRPHSEVEVLVEMSGGRKLATDIRIDWKLEPPSR